MKEGMVFVVESLRPQAVRHRVNLYGRRFTIEERFRDIKDWRFGMGVSAVRMANPHRRDRLLLIVALAQTLLQVLGAAGESLGMDRLARGEHRQALRALSVSSGPNLPATPPKNASGRGRCTPAALPSFTA